MTAIPKTPPQTVPAWPPWSDVQAMDAYVQPVAETNPWTSMQTGLSALASRTGRAWPAAQSWAPASASPAEQVVPEEQKDKNDVQELLNLPEAMMLAKIPEQMTTERLSYQEMALRYPDQAVVILGSSLWLADSALACIRTASQWGQPLTTKKYAKCESYLEASMRQYAPNGWFFYETSHGGKIDDVMKMMIKQCELLQKRAEERRLVAPGKFPVFEYGTLCLFHHDFCKDGKVRHQVRYKENSGWGKK